MGRKPCQLILYVTGENERAQKTVTTLKKICTEYLNGSHELHVVDVLERPDIARREKIFVTPSLERAAPQPRRRVVGDFLDADVIVKRLALGAFLDKQRE